MSEDQKFEINLLGLSDDVLLIILSMLNSFDKYNIYCTCSKLKNLICTSAVSKSQCFSFSPFASGEFLKCRFIKDVSLFIQELNLCSVQNLSKSVLVPCLRKMPTLKSLNVSYTNIVIPDLLDVIVKCPLKNISMNFKIFAKEDKTKIPFDLVKQCQEMFKNVENVHFVGSVENLIFSTLPILILGKAKTLKHLKFTVLKKFASVSYENEYVDYNHAIHFVKFSLHFGEWRYSELCNFSLPFSPLFHLLESNLNMQFVVIDRTSLIVSTGLKDYFENNSINSVLIFKMCSSLNGILLYDNAIVTIWNSDKITLNTLFLEKATKEIKSLIPNAISYTASKKEIIRNYNDYFEMNYYTDVEQCVLTSNKKVKRTAPLANILDFNDVLGGHRNIKLVLNFVGPPAEVKFSPEGSYLKQMRLLHLNGFVKYGCDFFITLFKCCSKLTTLIITNLKTSSCLINLINSLPQAQSLKIFMFRGDNINYNMLFESLSKSQNIENIFVVEISPMNFYNLSIKAPEDIINGLNKLITESQKLYNLYICISMSNTTRGTLCSKLEKLKRDLHKNYLNIEIFHNKGSYKGPSYDPYIDVFDLEPIKYL